MKFLDIPSQKHKQNNKDRSIAQSPSLCGGAEWQIWFDAPQGMLYGVLSFVYPTPSQLQSVHAFDF